MIKLFKNTIYIPCFIILICSSTLSCSNSTTPKPMGYFRIDLPEHSYKSLESDMPCTFNISEYSNIMPVNCSDKEDYCMNIEYPQYKGTIYLSYKHVNNNLHAILEDSRQLAYKHTVKADAIGEKTFESRENKVYGILYDITGDAASSVQFFVTDSTEHFLRGALYFNVVPNKDSIAPVSSYIKEDIYNLIETVKWK